MKASLLSPEAPLSPAPIRVGVLGLGRAGLGIHVAALQQNPRFSIVAVCDPLEARRVEVAASLGAQPVESLEALVASGLCEAIVIATPSRNHFEDAKMVLNSGIHCILEKPMATTSAEAYEIVEWAERKGLHLFVHHQYRFDSELILLEEVIASGVIGELFHIDIFWAGYHRRWDWQTLRKNGGGQLLNTCPHLLTLLLPLLGGYATLQSGSVRLIKDAGDTEDDVRFVLKGSNGVTASATVTSACALPMPRLTLYGSCGTLQEDYQSATLRYYDPQSVPVREVVDDVAPTDGSLVETLPWREEKREIEYEPPTGRFYHAIAETLRAGAPFPVAPNEAARIIAILEAISASYRTCG